MALTATGRGMLAVALLAVAAKAGPIFLGEADATAGADARLQPVMAGQKKEFVLTLTAATTEMPELGGELFAVAGGLAAPLFTNEALKLQRVGEARAGVQRFRFAVDIPAAEKKQALLLHLRIRFGAADTWLPLPPVNLEVSPRTWKETLRQFTRQVPSGRLAGSAQLAQIFRVAEIETPEATAEEAATDMAVRVWFAEATGDALRLPETPRAVWVVFRTHFKTTDEGSEHR